MEKLTPKQIQNWRNILLQQLGPMALLLTDKQVQAHKDKMQQKIDKEN